MRLDVKECVMFRNGLGRISCPVPCDARVGSWFTSYRNWMDEWISVLWLPCCFVLLFSDWLLYEVASYYVWYLSIICRVCFFCRNSKTTESHTITLFLAAQFRRNCIVSVGEEAQSQESSYSIAICLFFLLLLFFFFGPLYWCAFEEMRVCVRVHEAVMVGCSLSEPMRGVSLWLVWHQKRPLLVWSGVHDLISVAFQRGSTDAPEGN